MVAQHGYCPITDTKGKQVDNATIKSLVSISLRKIHQSAYYFCGEANCDVVYFSEDGSHLIHTHELQANVYQKEPEDPDVLICYCFQHKAEQVKADIKATGKTMIVDDIKAGIKAGQCACDLRNPQGDCCLGNVYLLIKQLKQKDKNN
jgi:hypothetical protein